MSLPQVVQSLRKQSKDVALASVLMYWMSGEN